MRPAASIDPERAPPARQEMPSGERTKAMKRNSCRVTVVAFLVALGRTRFISRRNRARVFGVGRLHQPGAGVESGLHRHTDCYEYGELLQPAARGDSSHRHLRRVQRYRAPLHTNPRRQQRASRRLAPSCGHCCGIHRDRRPLPVLDAVSNGRRSTPSMRLPSRR